MKKSKIYTLLWYLYAVFYASAWLRMIFNARGEGLDFYLEIIVAVILLIGMVGYIAALKIAYKLLWKVFFSIILFSFVLAIINGICFDLSALLVLLLFVPALYALYAYVYRSGYIWEGLSKSE